MSQTRGIRLLLDRATGISGDSDIEKLMRRVIPLYYSRLDPTDHARIEINLSVLPPGASDEDELFEILQSSNPPMQKLFQLYGKKVSSRTLSGVLARLQNGLRADAIGNYRDKTADFFKRPFEQVFPNFQISPVAAASVAQVHKSDYVVNGRTIQVGHKIRRPHYLERTRRDFDLFDKIVTDKFGREVIAKLKRSSLAEGDFRIEAENIIKGRQYRVARVVGLAPDAPVFEDSLVMTWVDGMTFSRLDTETPRELKNRYRNFHAVYEEWLEHTFNGTGFFHGDPHGGNLSQNLQNQRPIAYLDFGNAGTLPQNLQSAFAGLSLAVTNKNAVDILRKLSMLRGRRFGPVQERILTAGIAQVLRNPNLSIVETITGIFALVVEHDMAFPEAAVELQRAMMLFELEFQSMRQKYLEMTGAANLSREDTDYFAQFGPDSANVRVIGKKFGKDAITSLLGRLFG